VENIVMCYKISLQKVAYQFKAKDISDSALLIQKFICLLIYYKNSFIKNSLIKI